MRRRSWQFLSLMLWVSACAGTSTGNPFDPGDPIDPGDTSENTGSGSCDEAKTVLESLDAESALGFSAADMLALAQAHAETSIEWSMPNGGVSVAPESGTGTLTIRIEPTDAKPRFVHRSPKTGGGSGNGIEIANVGGTCADTLELDVDVSVSTGGGALDEHFSAKLTARSAAVARIYLSRKASEIEGRFEAQSSQPNAMLDGIQLSFAFSKLGPSGDLGVSFTARSGSGNAGSISSSAVSSLAHWPAGERCDDDPVSGTGFVARADQAVDQFSAKDGVERFNATALQLAAASGAPMKLSASFAAVGGACAVLEETGFGPKQSLPVISVSGMLTLRSEDGSIDGKWPMQLSASAAEDGSLGAVKIAYDLQGSMVGSLVQAGVFESTYGVHGLDMSGFDQAGVLLNVTIGVDAKVSGELIVNGVTIPDCQKNPPQPMMSSNGGLSTPGCAGWQFTQVWVATISG